jgi:Protein of unknown function (DUF2889)
MEAGAADNLPGFRRRFRVTPAGGWVRSEVEDDFHHMHVTVHHDGTLATSLQPVMVRAPWTTCPGAAAELERTFTGVALEAFSSRGEKQANCTHLYDLALLAAAHAADSEPTIYDILVSDPIAGAAGTKDRRAEVRRDGITLLAWVESGFLLSQPAELAGLRLDKMRAWIDTLDPELRQAARLLRWGNMIANGRIIPMEKQSDARRMPANCYTFQPLQAMQARRVGAIRDFSRGGAQPLDDAAP